MRGRSALCLAGVVAALASGCGDAGRRQPGSETGQYAGSRDGVGAMVDFRGSDQTTSRISDLLGTGGQRVALAYVVNHGDRPVVVPTFTAEAFDGTLTVLPRADQEPRLARLGLPKVRALAPDAAVTIYLLYSGSPSAITRIGMRRGIEPEVTLRPQEAGAPRPTADG